MDTDLLILIGRIFQHIGWASLPFLFLPVLCLLFPASKFLCELQFTLTSIIDSGNAKIGEGVKWLLVVLVVSIAFGVIALSIFGQSWTKFDESASYFHAAVIFLGSAATLLAGQHVRVDILYSKFPPKTKALIDILGYHALLIPFCLVLLWSAQNFVALAWISLEGSPEFDGIQGLFLLKTLVPVFGILILAQGMAMAGRAALFLTGKPAPPLPPHIDPLFQEARHGESEL